MKKYNLYKDSGIEWIGKMPKNWIVSKAKFVSNFRMGQTILKEDLVDNGEFPVYSATEGDHFFGYINNPNFILIKGDIVIPARGNSIGHVVLVKENCVSTQTTIASTVNQKIINSNFLFYFYKGFKSILFHFDQTAIPQITVNQVENNQIILPTLNEQIQIASFLDYKTNLIDATIEKKKRLIDLLKEKRQAVISEAVTKGLNLNMPMKDSGVEWLGEIPEHWDLVPLRYLYNKIGSGVTPKGGGDVYNDEGITFIRSQNVHFDGLRLDDVVKIDNDTHQKMNNSHVKFHDVLLNITGASIGRCCVVNIDEEMNVNQHVCIIRVNEKINPDYLNIVLQSNVGQIQIKLLTTGGNREGLTHEAVKNVIIPLPNIQTQIELLENVSQKLNTYDLINNKMLENIQKLQIYRQSLISEAVTGKIDVRGWQPIKK